MSITYTVITTLKGKTVSSFNADTLVEAYQTGEKLIEMGVCDDFRIW